MHANFGPQGASSCIISFTTMQIFKMALAKGHKRLSFLHLIIGAEFQIRCFDETWNHQGVDQTHSKNMITWRKLFIPQPFAYYVMMLWPTLLWPLQLMGRNFSLTVHAPLPRQLSFYAYKHHWQYNWFTNSRLVTNSFSEELYVLPNYIDIWWKNMQCLPWLWTLFERRVIDL